MEEILKLPGLFMKMGYLFVWLWLLNYGNWGSLYAEKNFNFGGYAEKKSFQE